MNFLKGLIFLFFLSLGHAASALVIEGTYTSSDGYYSVNITTANSSDGSIVGTYTSYVSPIGTYVETGTVGHFGWVNNSAGQSGVAPFSISFEGKQRPAGWPYIFRETWNGVYRVDNTILAAGTRSYVNSSGLVLVVNLGTVVFTRR
ncbi:hypothetical protein OU995_12305 [Roseateles sp. SL47]|jgi:hypothetical protein|uniref:hypothetical protein n=1 Tax=Roseateles sp. SL47 TaxID=2995138 RepID=UPI00226F4F4E|nr:hypothetical protein [Roseateles sp. SL47]WAC75427.1 hypothetical protein OU995_12305 [Roseateles sp. SL47]